MSYTFKLARRAARFRLALSSVLLVSALACSEDEPLTPVSDGLTPATPEVLAGDELAPEAAPADSLAADSLPADSLVVGDTLAEDEAPNEEGVPIDQGAPVEPEGSEADVASFSMANLSSSAAAAQRRKTGIPFGDFHLPTGVYGKSYTGGLMALWPSLTMKKLNAARAAGMRVVISMAGHRGMYTDRGRFNFTKWKRQIDQYKKYNYDSFIKDGTIIGHYLVDEPYCAPCWGGREITSSQIDQMARYSKQRWPKMATGVRGTATHLRKPVSSKLDFAWAQWEGPHVPSYRLTPEQFRDKEIAAAKRLGLGVVFGLNYPNGGSGSSRILGTYRNSRKVNRWAMSAAEVKKVASVFAASPYVCAVISWQYDTKVLRRSGMKSALEHVARVAKNRQKSSCVR